MNSARYLPMSSGNNFSQANYLLISPSSLNSSEKSVLPSSVLLLVKLSVELFEEKSSEIECSTRVGDIVLSDLNVTPSIQFRLVFGEFG